MTVSPRPNAFGSVFARSVLNASAQNSSSLAQQRITGSQPVATTVDPAGTFLYVVNEGSNTVSIFRISAIDGTLTAQAPAGTGPSPSGIVTVH